ncbi:MAG: GNAT family N-acetyltransferase [Acidimicrobiales bacterium]|jgi:ribosomal protein S18 acetylase RimI-like enzyme
MTTDSPDFFRTLGASARIWAGGGQHEVGQDWWLALSGELNVNCNLACCRSANSSVLIEHCLQPVLDLGQPGIIMLAGAGLATAQTLVRAGWVTVGALPLMYLKEPPPRRPEIQKVRLLPTEDLPAAREIVAASCGSDRSTAEAVFPDTAGGRSDGGFWGLSEGGRVIASVTIALEDGLAVVWSMGTRPEYQGRGYGRRVLEGALWECFDRGATGSVLPSSAAGEKLYRSLGYVVVDTLQLWSQPH